MRMRKHPTAACRRCRRRPVRFGLKAEATGWKVFCECAGERSCGHEWLAGRVAMADVASVDDAYRWGEELCER